MQQRIGWSSIPTPQKLVWFSRALLTVVRTRIALTFRRSDQIRASIVAHAPATQPLSWEMQLTAWSVAKAAKLVPGATCLTQAFAGQHMLARRGRQSMVRISIPAAKRDSLAPHAWLLADNRILLGGGPEEFVLHRTLLHYRSDAMAPVPASVTSDASLYAAAQG